MALADTAKLIVALMLEDKFSGPAKNATRQLGALDTKTSSLGKSTQQLGRGLGRSFTIIGAAAVGVAGAGIAALSVNVKAGVDSLNELEKVTTASETVIKSTGGAAGQSAEDVRKLAEEYETLNAVIDDKVIQNAENLLLTFTNVTDKAFEPALAAILDMNQAMGGGEEGLQGVAIQVGKALNDPVKGLTALSRVGVSFTQKQKARIKLLQEEGDLYGAQQIILAELSKEFGGQFANAGKTAEGQMARLGDAVEDLQQRLAGPLLPVIDRVRKKLTTFLESKTAQKAAKDLGDAIAGIFTNQNIDKGVAFIEDAIKNISGFLKGGGGDEGGLKTIASSIGGIASEVGALPWTAIGDAAKLLGTGSKALLDAFLGLPPWVQTAVLTGWGLNKLTGGAFSGILGGLAGALGKWVTQKLGLMTVQAAVVNVNGPAGGLPGKGGPGGLIPGGLLGGAAAGAAITTGVVAAGVATAMTVDFGARTSAQNERLIDTVAKLPRGTADELDDSLGKIDGAIDTANRDIGTTVISGVLGINHNLDNGRAELIRTRSDLARNIVRGTDDTTRTIDRVNSSVNLERTAAQAIAAADATRINSLRDSHASANTYLQAIRDKKSSFNVTVQSTTSIAVSSSQMALRVAQINQTYNWRQDTDETVQ